MSFIYFFKSPLTPLFQRGGLFTKFSEEPRNKNRSEKMMWKRKLGLYFFVHNLVEFYKITKLEVDIV